jgi:hypothetical protein
MKKYLITLLLLALITPSVAFASWWNPFSWKIFNREAEVKIEELEPVITLPSTPVNTPPEQTKELEKVSPTLPKEEANKIIPTIPREEDVELKIEKCKAIEEKAYNDAILKINQATNAKLEETFNSLKQQYEDEVKKINDNTDTKLSNLSGDYILFYSQAYNNEAIEKIGNLYENQQTFWKEQKREIENAKQKAIDQINLLLSEEYVKCLSN